MPPPNLRSWGTPLAAALAVAALWLGRDVLSFDVLARLVLPIFWIAVWTLACTGLGGVPARRLLRSSSDQPVSAVVALAAGACVLSFLATIMAWAGVLNPLVLGGILALSAIAGAVLLATGRLRLSPPDLGAEPASSILVLAAWGGLACLLTTPPVMFDVLNYHLAFPAHWLEAGGFLEFPRHSFSYYPSGHGMAYSYALATVGPWGASAVHWWFGALAALAAGEIGRRLAGPRAGWWALCLFALTPAALQSAGYAAADLAVAAWGGAALLVLLDEIDSRRWALAGALTGAAVTAKYLALATVALPIAAAAASVMIAARNRSWRPALLLGLVAAIVAAPWFLRNLLWTGNPLYPYLQGFFGGPASPVDIGFEVGRNDLAGTGVLAAAWHALIAVPLRTFLPLRQGGLIGLQWIILLPVLAALKRPQTRAWLPVATAALIGAIAWGGLVHYARFLLPVLVPAAALAGTAAAALTSTESVTLRRAFHGLLIALLAWNATILATELNLDRLGVVSGQVAEHDFMRDWVSYSPALDTVNLRLPEDAVLLMVAESRSLYVNRAVMVEDPFRQPWLLDLAEEASSPGDLARRVRELGPTHVLVNTVHGPWVARLRGADAYWSGASAPALQRVESLLRDHTQRLYSENGVWVGRILPPS